MNIYQALANINKQVEVIKKVKKNTSLNFMFRGIDDMMNSLHKLFAENEVIVLPEITSYDVQEKTSVKGTIMYYTRANITFHFVAADGSEVKISNIGEAMDSGDKGMTKAMSIALKYALMQMFLIPTEDIEDADSHTPEETEDVNLLTAIDDAQRSTTVEELNKVWVNWKYYQQNAKFLDVVKKRKLELEKNDTKR